MESQNFEGRKGSQKSLLTVSSSTGENRPSGVKGLDGGRIANSGRSEAGSQLQ